ncbi:MAG: universal stress protein [Candidatus Rokubacteria bacterium]|nr:universal stress protein [Candidatus Rokubacteria bacterium]
MSVHEILLATDFSDPADAAALVAREYADRFDARVHLFHVLRSGEQEVTRLLTHLRGTLGERIPVTIASTLGDAADEIVRYARARGIDLIVLGTHGRTGLSRAILGSVAERVIRHAPCPVLAVPARPAAMPGAPLAPPTERLSRCLVCAQPSRDLICEPCRAKIRGEALEHKMREERAGRP